MISPLPSAFFIDPKKSTLKKFDKSIFDINNCYNLNDNEWIYLFIYAKYKLIIPCKTVYKYFYANDKTLNNITNKGNLFEYCFDYKIQNNFVNIHLKNFFSKYYIIRFSKILSNKVYRNGFFYHYFQRYINKPENEIISILPTFEKFKIFANFIKLKDNLLLITEIYRDNIKYPFNTIFPYVHESNHIIKYKIELQKVFITNLYNNFNINILRKINNDQDLKIIKDHEIKIFIRNEELNKHYIEPFNIIDNISFIACVLNFSEIYPYNPVCIITIDYPNIKNNIWILKGFKVNNLNKPGIFIDDLNPIIKYFYDKNQSLRKLKNYIKQTYNYDFYSLSISNLYLTEEKTYKKYKEIKKLLLKIKKEFT